MATSLCGVAIKTNASKLRKSLKANNEDKQIDVYHVEVEYKNHIALDQMNDREIAATKREFYDGENEVRLFFNDSRNSLNVPQDKKGIILNLDPSYVIDEVYLSPFGGKSFNDAFGKMLGQRYGWLRNRVKQSEILDS